TARSWSTRSRTSPTARHTRAGCAWAVPAPSSDARADGVHAPLAHQPGEDSRQPPPRGEAGRPHGARARARPDAHARPLAALLGAVPDAPREPARASHR